MQRISQGAEPGKARLILILIPILIPHTRGASGSHERGRRIRREAFNAPALWSSGLCILEQLLGSKDTAPEEEQQQSGSREDGVDIHLRCLHFDKEDEMLNWRAALSPRGLYIPL